MSLGLAAEKPLELSCDRYREPDQGALGENQNSWSEGRQGALGQCPPRQGDVSLGLAPKSPWSLAVTVTENRTKGRWGSAHPARETCLWAWRRSKKPLELSCDRYREPDQGALGQCPPRQGDVSLGLASLEKAPGAPLFKRSKPKSTKSHVQSFPDGTSNQLPLTDPPPGSRSNPEPTRGRGAVPGLPRRLRHPGCLAQAPVFDLVVFPNRNSSRVHSPHGRAREGRPWSGKAGRGPEATVPAAGDPQNLIPMAPQNGFP
ncbi:hypothetical protein G5714_024710 [Onychostoma macrolepis]|uniref:Uncharacterized protein n=1 Tax=Onychostoma macrolepis TaxID=369639 RepID=A0A7J6BHK5_9TELE|nr:hypothetical protein G5714_024710 [Onychostoma macrolepis]